MRNSIILFKRSIIHAWSRTTSTFGGWGLVYLLVLAPLVGFSVHYLIAGWAKMMEEVEVWLVYIIIGTGAVFLAVFFWNLICAPYRLEKEAHELTIKSLEDAKTTLAKEEASGAWDGTRFYFDEPILMKTLPVPNRDSGRTFSFEVPCANSGDFVYYKIEVDGPVHRTGFSIAYHEKMLAQQSDECLNQCASGGISLPTSKRLLFSAHLLPSTDPCVFRLYMTSIDTNKNSLMETNVHVIRPSLKA